MAGLIPVYDIPGLGGIAILRSGQDNASVNSSCAQVPPPPFPGLLRGICLACQSRGQGICKLWSARGWGCSQAFDTHVVSYQNLTMKRILLEKQAYWLFCQGQGKIEEGCWHVFDFMHAFLHCLSSQNYIAKSGAIKVTR